MEGLFNSGPLIRGLLIRGYKVIRGFRAFASLSAGPKLDAISF